MHLPGILPKININYKLNTNCLCSLVKSLEKWDNLVLLSICLKCFICLVDIYLILT